MWPAHDARFFPFYFHINSYPALLPPQRYGRFWIPPSPFRIVHQRVRAGTAPLSFFAPLRFDDVGAVAFSSATFPTWGRLIHLRPPLNPRFAQPNRITPRRYFFRGSAGFPSPLRLFRCSVCSLFCFVLVFSKRSSVRLSLDSRLSLVFPPVWASLFFPCCPSRSSAASSPPPPRRCSRPGRVPPLFLAVFHFPRLPFPGRGVDLNCRPVSNQAFFSTGPSLLTWKDRDACFLFSSFPLTFVPISS